ncbi:MAG: GGDEF domain-containing protein [Lachnospiraceae bacterium]|nr:GGDEF domain-containing protein [Lachnospiraceae bacterium]
MFTEEIDKEDFYQSKYDYYKQFSFWVIVFSSLASITYFISDCQLFDRFAIETLLPRTIIIIPMLIYIFLAKKIQSYKTMVVIEYIIIHMIMWTTIWAIYFLPIKTHASEGFIIMHLMFCGIGFSAPFKYSTFFHSLVIVNILVSNLFNHYENLDIMLSLGLPCLFAICFINYFMQKLYVGHYLTAKKMEYISRYDHLTDVYNRNVLGELIDTETEQFLSSIGKPVSVMIFDIDFFKKVNDTYGHVKGDQVLKSLADTVKPMIEKNDYMLRWGGEEFVLILSERTLEEASAFAEKVRKAVETSDNGVCPVTVSIGVAAYDGKNYKSAIDEADQALYRAKENGRNRVEVS